MTEENPEFVKLSAHQCAVISSNETMKIIRSIEDICQRQYSPGSDLKIILGILWGTSAWINRWLNTIGPNRDELIRVKDHVIKSITKDFENHEATLGEPGKDMSCGL